MSPIEELDENLGLWDMLYPPDHCRHGDEKYKNLFLACMRLSEASHEVPPVAKRQADLDRAVEEVGPDECLDMVDDLLSKPILRKKMEGSNLLSSTTVFRSLLRRVGFETRAWIAAFDRIFQFYTDVEMRFAHRAVFADEDFTEEETRAWLTYIAGTNPSGSNETNHSKFTALRGRVSHLLRKGFPRKENTM